MALASKPRSSAAPEAEHSIRGTEAGRRFTVSAVHTFAMARVPRNIYALPTASTSADPHSPSSLFSFQTRRSLNYREKRQRLSAKPDKRNRISKCSPCPCNFSHYYIYTRRLCSHSTPHWAMDCHYQRRASAPSEILASFVPPTITPSRPPPHSLSLVARSRVIEAGPG